MLHQRTRNASTISPLSLPDPVNVQRHMSRPLPGQFFFAQPQPKLVMPTAVQRPFSLTISGAPASF
ncbi:hypothetical protein TYRP_001477 [Tyrophagus putrescentiae]|nr:hypothetical protein TYRP_001477 [Tyrophagus putrescentiae]